MAIPKGFRHPCHCEEPKATWDRRECLWCNLLVESTEQLCRTKQTTIDQFDKLEFGSVLQLQYSRHLSELFI